MSARRVSMIEPLKAAFAKVVLAMAVASMLGGMAPLPERYREVASGARAAREGGDMARYLRHVRELFSMVPGHPGSRFSLARALSLTGDRSGAIQELRTLTDQGFGYDAEADPAFAALRGDPSFAEVSRRLAANRQPGGRSAAESIHIGMAGRQPEGVAALDANGSFVVGSSNGDILAVGKSAPRVLARGDGMVAGIRPDPSTNTFLACISDEGGGRAVVRRHRITDGALVAMYPMPASRPFCNDIAVTNDGGFVVTESNGGRVYRMRGGRLDPLPIDPLLYPNGIATDPASGRIYIAHANGIGVFDPQTGSSVTLASEGTILGGIDGLVWHKSGLIALQNVTVPARLLRIVPSASGLATVEPLMTGSPLLEGATTIAIQGGEAYVLSHTGIPGGAPPNDPILVRVPL